MAEKWVTLAVGCQVLGISDRTLRRRINDGAIQSKLEGGRRLVRVDIPDSQSVHTSRDVVNGGVVTSIADAMLNGQLHKENEYLRGQLERKDEQITALQSELSESRHRQDTIVLQITRQLEQSQRLLDYHHAPWYRRWFRRSRMPGDETR